MKTCRTCGESKDLMEFYGATTGNIDRDCKACRCAKVRANRLVKVDQYRAYERGRAMLPHRIECRDAYAKTPNGMAAVLRGKRSFQARNPVKRAAHVAVGNAIRAGKMKRQGCETCGRRAQAHHDDYSKPLDVRWLCPKHHAEWHRSNTPICPDQEQAA